MGRWLETALGAALAAGLALASPASAVTLDYTSFHVLGDSLSDAGNVYRASLRQVPKSPPYWRGRFSNGKVWADRVGDVFRAEDLPTGNHAWGGSNIAPRRVDVPSLSQQAVRYRSLDSDRRGDRPLLAIWTGGNDMLDAAGRSDVSDVARAAARRLGSVALTLKRTGTDDFMLLNLPDIGKVPKFRGDAADSRRATRGTLAFNRELDRQISRLRGAGARVVKVDVYRLFNDLLRNPEEYGITDTRRPCLDEDDNICSRTAQRGRAFFDEIHPNLIVHRAIADAALGRIGAGPRAISAAAAAPMVAPVPVPLPGALLLGGIALLGGLRYQRSRRGPARAPSPTSPETARPYQAA